MSNNPPISSSRPPSFSPPPNSYSPNCPGLPTSFNPIPPSLSARMTSTPPSGAGPSYSFQPPPSSYPSSGSFTASATPPSSLPPSMRSPHAFFESSAQQGKTPNFTPNAIPSGIPSSWASPPSLTLSLPTTSQMGSTSPSAYAVSPSSFSSPHSVAGVFSNPSSFSGSSFIPQPPSLSGRVHWVSISSLVGALPGLNQGTSALTFSMPKSFSFGSIGQGSVNSLVPMNYKRNISLFEGTSQVRPSLQLEMEQTMKAISLLDAPPESPIPLGGILGVTQLAFQITPQTTVFIDPFAVTEFFQRATLAESRALQAQLAQLTKMDSQFNWFAASHMKSSFFELATPSANNIPEGQNPSVNSTDPSFEKPIGESAREILSGPIHEAWKAVGILGKNTLLLIEDLNPSISKGPRKGRTFREAWETEAVPSVHEQIDQVFSTNIQGDFDPRKDGPFDQAVQNFFLNPLTYLGGGASAENVVRQGIKAGERVFKNTGPVFAQEAVATDGAAVRATRPVGAFKRAGAAETGVSDTAQKVTRNEPISALVPESAAMKKTNVYAPNRPLPVNKDGVPISETNAPNTQLGIKESKRNPGKKYVQAREFDTNGKPVKTIDFTDHGEPLIHPNPHEHLCEPNPSGGTSQRGDPKPLENWKY
jgi:hypothetical protein